MDIPESLSTLAADFSIWRKQKSKISAPVPDSLRQRTISLLDSYQTGQITAALRITTLQLSQWRIALRLETSPTFIEITSQAFTPQPSINLELCFVSGEKMCLHGINNQTLLSIIEAIKS